MKNAITAAVVALLVATTTAGASSVTIPHGERLQNHDIAVLNAEVAGMQQRNQLRDIRIQVLKDRAAADEKAITELQTEVATLQANQP